MPHRRRSYRAARPALARIDTCEGFVAGDGSPLAELREQLVDEIANYQRRAIGRRALLPQHKGSRFYKPQITTQRARVAAPIKARLVGVSDNVRGSVFELFADSSIGRSTDNEIVVPHPSLSRRHTRFVYVEGAYMVQDLGSTNGTLLNGKHVDSCALADRDEVKIGDIVVRFEIL